METISDEVEDDKLLAISLTSEAQAGDPQSSLPLGVVTVSSTCQNIQELRETLTRQLATLPPEFLFCTSQGWPIQKPQEARVKVSQLIDDRKVIQIIKCYSKPRVGIQTAEGAKLGFVFAELNIPVNILRKEVDKQVTVGGTYVFKDRNGWPVSCCQEDQLTAMDLMIGSSVFISITQESVSRLMVLPGMRKEWSPVPTSPVSQRCSMAKQITYRSSKDQERHGPASVNSSGHIKQILISYVRAEAAHHALSLKRELMDLGFSVFLDVHEIKTGVDWQDALNDAVSQCEVFVPLVTPRYGETQWTNREVKLADVLDKFILPVSFLDDWPPKCLAIQFATTQFIPWKTSQQMQEEYDRGEAWRAIDIHFWDTPCVKQAANSIAECLHQSEMKQHQRVVTGILRRKPSAKSLLEMQNSESQDENQVPLLVICVHPQQRACGEELRIFLEDRGYEAWCSCDLDIAASVTDSDELSQEDGLLGSQENLFSQLSNMSEADCVRIEQRLKFQEKADQANLIILMLSQAFSKSRMCRQQVFYCERRKKIIPVIYENFCMPWWMSMLIGSGTFEDVRHNTFHEALVKRVQRLLESNKNEPLDLESEEEHLSKEAKKLKDVFSGVVTVYISGSTRFYDKFSEEICIAIGQHLAKLDDVHLVTGGFYGVGQTVGRTYHEARAAQHKQSNVWHVLPERDEKDCSLQANQKADKSFAAVPYGWTLYSGDSVLQRGSIVSRVFDICVLVEGGPGAAHEVERFVWNDRCVVPVRRTGGAAGGKFNVPDIIKQMPTGASDEDWQTLSNKTAAPDEVGQAVSRIVRCLSTKIQVNRAAASQPPIKRAKTHNSLLALNVTQTQ